MNERIKKAVYGFLYRMLAAAVVFLCLAVLKRFMPHSFIQLSAIWRKNADLNVALEHVTAFLKEMLPF